MAVIISTESAESTYDEAVALRELSADEGWESVILITDPYHTRRTGLTFRPLMPELAFMVSAAPSPEFDVPRWYSKLVQHEDRLLVGVFNEIIKLGCYWVHYGILPIRW